MSAAIKTHEKATPQGHAVHTKDADEPRGLAGVFNRPLKFTMMGAGSGFTPRLLNDIMRIPGHQGGEIALVDIDSKRLSTMIRVIQNLAKNLGQGERWKVTGSADRTEVMGGSDYLINCIEVSGLACVAHDNDIPLKYGVDQCIGDTIGPGGLFKSLRTIPVFLEVLQDAQRLCPKALVLNYTNPMNMMCLAAARTSWIPLVGLCHSVQGTSHLLAKYAEVPYEELEWDCAGINHLAWFTKLEHKGRNLYPKLHEKFKREIAEGTREADHGLASHDDLDVRLTKSENKYQQADLIRKDMCVHFGAFITESSGHLSEYLPYYRKSEAGRKLLRRGYDGGSRFYATNWPAWRAAADRQRQALVDGEEELGWKRSREYASWIIEGREKDVPQRIYGNVPNHDGTGRGQLISNLPADGCVEVACMIDRNGIHPVRYGALPAQMAHVCESNMAMFDLGATACIEKSKEAAIHALMLDPLCAAVCTPGQIRDMTLEMFEAEAEYLPGYK